MQILRNANFVVFLKLANRSLYLNCMVIGISFITMKSCVVDLSSKEISIRHTTLSIRQVNCIGYIRQRRLQSLYHTTYYTIHQTSQLHIRHSTVLVSGNTLLWTLCWCRLL